MNLNLLDAVKGFFNNDLVNKAAGYLGESEAGIKNGLETIIPVGLTGIINKAQSAPESLHGYAKDAFNSGILNKVGDFFKPGGVSSTGSSLLTNVMGDKFGSISNAISGFTGLKSGSVSSLLGSVIPLALGLIGKNATENNLSPSGVASWLGSMKNSILSLIPAGLNISSLMPGLRAASAVNMVTPAVPKKRVNWLVPMLLGLAALLLIWWLSRKPDTTVARTVVEDTVETPKVVMPTVTKESLKLSLPNGVELDAYRGGIEDRLIAFIKDPGATVNKDTWFDFNDLNFKFGTAEIVPESRNELENLIKILKAYPKVKVKIGGYTDKVGDEAANKKLSADRAKAVANELKAAGVGGQVTDAEGYGSEFAKFPPEAPEEQRIKDRRVSVSVREK